MTRLAFTLHLFEPSNPTHRSTAAAIWSAACSPDLAISPRFVEFNTRPSTGAVQLGQVAIQDDQIVGFILASAAPNAPEAARPDHGWIDAIAVAPDAQRQGIGSALLDWGEIWLHTQHVTSAHLGGSLRPFTPGLPDELHNENFFRARGYAGQHETWDVARDLGDYTLTLPQAPKPAGGLPTTRPAQAEDESALREFFVREFPGRWRYEFEEHLREGGRLSDYTVLVSERGIDGFCFLTFEDSPRPLERFYMHRLPRPWGQAGPLGVSADRRKLGYGLVVVDAGLRRLRDAGVRGCVIDWTGLLDFYGKFGFKPHRKYLMLSKKLAD